MKTILVDAVNTFVVNGKIFKKMQELLDQYPNSKIVLTNANDEQISKFGLNNLPYELFTLKHSPDKVDRVYFEKMLKNFNLNKDDVIYFEHNKEAVRSAESVGIISYHYEPKNKDLVALKKFIDKNL